MRIAQDDGGVVVDARIDLRLVGLRDGGDAERSFAVHEPGHEVGAIAAEVVESARAVLRGIGEPLEKFGLNADFFGALMAVVNDDFANFAEAAVLQQVVDGAVAGVPGGFVIHEHLNVVFARDAADGERVVEGKRERLFDHDVEIVGRGGLDDAAVLADGGVDKQRLRMLVSEEVVEGRVEKIVVEVELLLVFGAAARGRRSTMPTSSVSCCWGNCCRKPVTWPCSRPTMATRTGTDSGAGWARRREQENSRMMAATSSEVSSFRPGMYSCYRRDKAGGRSVATPVCGVLA